MTDRLSSADVWFFYLEGRTTPQHVGGLAVFEAPPDGFDYERLVRLLEERISLVPRYRQKMRAVPGNLANPVWIDDPNFDITYHVRRSALPRPGNDQALLEFCGRIQPRLLDRNRPLWEMYLIEGLSGGRIAIVTKTHHSMVDGVGAIDIAQVLLDASPEPRRTVQGLWMPEPEPRPAQLVCDALTGVMRRPSTLADAIRLGVRDVRSMTGWLTAALSATASAASGVARRRHPLPLHATLGQQRRIAIARTRLEDYRQVRLAHGGTVNDVVLATVAGALRGWLLSRGEALTADTTVRALVPVSVSGEDEFAATGEWTNRVTALLVDLPVGEFDPVRRLELVRDAMAEHKASGLSVGADALVALSGFAPPTLHALGARAANGLTRRMYSLVVTNVPGPQVPMYAAGARMTEMFPILPLNRGQAVSIGLTSYDGGVYYGINGDRDAAADVSVLAALMTESLADLVAATPPTQPPLVEVRGAATGRGATRVARRARPTAARPGPRSREPLA